MTIMQAEATLVRLEAEKQEAERELAEAKAKMKTLNVQMVIALIGSIMIFPIIWLIFLIAVQLPSRSKAVKAAEAKLRAIENAIMGRRIEIADLRAKAAGA